MATVQKETGDVWGEQQLAFGIYTIQVHVASFQQLLLCFVLLSCGGRGTYCYTRGGYKILYKNKDCALYLLLIAKCILECSHHNTTVN